MTFGPDVESFRAPDLPLLSSQPGQSCTLAASQIQANTEVERYAPFSSPVIAIVGASFGDEGKGRTVLDVRDMLTKMTGDQSPVEMVIKVNGGRNSGHTVDKLKHNLIPAGVTDPSIRWLALGRGVVADPINLLTEIRSLELLFAEKNLPHEVRGRLLIDNRTMMSDFTDRMLDLGREIYRVACGGEPRGSTKQGITPAFSHETNQGQIFFELFSEGLDPELAVNAKERFAQLMRERVEEACLCIKGWLMAHAGTALPQKLDVGSEICEETWFRMVGNLQRTEEKKNQEWIDKGFFRKQEFDFTRYLGDASFTLNVDRLIEDYWVRGLELARTACISDVGEAAHAAIARGKHAVLEFGQSYWLHARKGYSPNVTASRTYVTEAYDSVDLPHTLPIHSLAVVKAYKTAVGTHFVPTELDQSGALYKKLQPLEFGTTTGRQRMIAWFDAVEVGHVLRRGGFNDLVINKLDALSEDATWNGESLKICVGYRTPGEQELHFMPTSDARRRLLTPIYREMPGWKEDLSGVREFSQLPRNAQLYIAAMCKAIDDVANYNGKHLGPQPNLRGIGVGPERSQFIVRGIPQWSELIEMAAADERERGIARG